MKMTHEMSTVDRISTHEELHQVLALLNDSADRVMTEEPSETEEESALQEAVSSLWQDSEEEEAESDASHWTKLTRFERVN